jgi:hypothetical protein
MDNVLSAQKEYRIFKPVELTIRRVLMLKEEKWRERANSRYNTYIHGNIIMKLPM